MPSSVGLAVPWRQSFAVGSAVGVAVVPAVLPAVVPVVDGRRVVARDPRVELEQAEGAQGIFRSGENGESVRLHSARRARSL